MKKRKAVKGVPLGNPKNESLEGKKKKLDGK